MNRVALTAIALTLSACAGSPAMQAAEQGDHASMRREMETRQKAGDLSNDEARRIALKVVSHEIEIAKGDDAIARIKESRACVPDVSGLLEKRMETHDAVGAEAARVLYEDGKLQSHDAREYVDDADDRWRAVGAAGLVRDVDGPARRRALIDPSTRVRRAAIYASVIAFDDGDANALFDIIRTDADPFARTDALRSLGMLAGDRSSPDAKPIRIAREISLRFMDIWPTADDALREDIASQLAISPLYEAGGRDRLRIILDDGHGAGVIEAAAAISRRKPRDADKDQSQADADIDKELHERATGILIRAIESGSKRERSHALAAAPLFPSIVEAMKKAKTEDDLGVRVSILARLTQVAPERAAAVKELELLAAKKDDEELSARAKLALASAGDLRVQAWIEEDLGSKSPLIRVGAATALAALGRPARGALLFGDEDASVRTRAACMVAASARYAHKN